jgi:hypothetical protein
MFQFSPNDFKAPPLLKNLEVIYGWCGMRGEPDANGKRHKCMRGDPWSKCDYRCEEVGEVWREIYVCSAGGQVIEKWRELEIFQFFGREGVLEYELLWRSPFSNSFAKDRPELPMGGYFSFHVDVIADTCTVPIIKGWHEVSWRFARDSKKVRDMVKEYYENR